MKKTILYPLIALAAVIIAVVIYSFIPDEAKTVQLMTKVERGKFEIVIPVTGELRAEKSTQIKAPMELRGRNLRIRSLKIQSMVEEGTLVDSGDWVASLDRSEADNGYKDVLNYLETVESNFTKARLDTSIQLRQLRNDLINLKFNMEEMKIKLEQDIYEPPATIRQDQMNLDKSKRAYQQALLNYDLRVIQAKATMREARINLERAQRTMQDTEAALRNFDIKAPAPGMVIYSREHNGVKRTVGSEINTWDLVVAELPDLSSMVSRTYVNEIDISKIKKAQQVRIGVDAFPEKNYTGEVLTVGNIGQQLPNADAKVFEVLIKLFERDTILRPSMTTSNKIITKEFDDVVYIPLECVHSNDSIPFVYTKKGHRQVIVLGEPNENFVIVENGIKGGDEIFLSVPEEPEKFHYEGMELAQIIREKEAEKARKIKEMNDSLKRNSPPQNFSTSGMPQRGNDPSLREDGQEDRNQIRNNSNNGATSGRGMRQRGGGTQ